MNYSQFMHALKTLNIDLNRKVLSNMAIEDKESFASLAKKAKEAVA